MAAACPPRDVQQFLKTEKQVGIENQETPDRQYHFFRAQDISEGMCQVSTLWIAPGTGKVMGSVANHYWTQAQLQFSWKRWWLWVKNLLCHGPWESETVLHRGQNDQGECLLSSATGLALLTASAKINLAAEKLSMHKLNSGLWICKDLPELGQP